MTEKDQKEKERRRARKMADEAWEAVETKLARRKQTFAEILKPVHDAIEASGMSDEDVDSLVDKELKVVRTERRSARPQP